MADDVSRSQVRPSKIGSATCGPSLTSFNPGLLGSATQFKGFLKSLEAREHNHYAPLRKLGEPLYPPAPQNRPGDHCPTCPTRQRRPVTAI